VRAAFGNNAVLTSIAFPRTHRLPPSPRLRGEGWGEGPFFEFGKKRLQNPIRVLNDIVVPDADHAIPESAQPAVALPVLETLRVLTAVDFDNQAALAANEVNIVSIDRLLAGEFEAAELPTANT
jgi:hypothetical protein